MIFLLGIPCDDALTEFFVEADTLDEAEEIVGIFCAERGIRVDLVYEHSGVAARRFDVRSWWAHVSEDTQDG